MVPEEFVDGVGAIGFAGGIVRIDLVSLSLQATDQRGAPAREVRRRLLMTPQGLIDCKRAIDDMVARLAAAGHIAAAPASPPAVAEVRPVAGDIRPAAPRSPNFDAG